MTASSEANANRPFRRKRRSITRLLTVTLLVTVSAVFGFLSPASAAEVGDTPDPASVQTNGQVRSIIQVEDRIYLGGSFTSVGGQPRNRLAALDADTGEVTDWSPGVNKLVYALEASPDGSRIYAGGAFTSFNGDPREHLVAIDADSGNIVPEWVGKAEPNNTVFSLATLGSRVYFGGYFRNVSGDARTRLAAVDGATGVLDTKWKPTANENVRTLISSIDGGQIYAGGQFTNVSGTNRKHLAAFNPVTGAVKGWRPNPCYPVFDLDEAPAGAGNTDVFVAGGGVPEACNAGGWAEAFEATRNDRVVTGDSLWKESSNGDFQAVAVMGATAYFGGHHDEIPFVPAPGHGERWLRFTAFDADDGDLDMQWRPEADAGIWAMTADPERRRIYAGGVFTEINDEAQQGFAWFD